MELKAAIFLVTFCVATVYGHGYLVEPPGRASAWRYGFDTPTDYNDNECFCGGFNHQYSTNDGKCGICGDAWEEDPREHEVGSIYATGTIVKTYQSGQVIPVTANITTNHLGHFEYKICPNNDVTVEATQECLDMTPLYGVDREDFFLYIGAAMKEVHHELQLPADLTCTQCVLQWRYVAGNNWGQCENGTESIGCGPQEEFRACADVAILPQDGAPRPASGLSYSRKGTKPDERVNSDGGLANREEDSVNTSQETVKDREKTSEEGTVLV